jgi:thiol-disulfide isomerase/thioredoxin
MGAIRGKFKGKLIYVDFWGSFCGACIEEFPSLDKMKKRFAGKDIVFVRISIDKNISDWKNSVKRLKIDDPNSYMLSDFKNSKMAERLQLTGVPRYILFDKKGNVVLLNAPRPGEENFGDIIENFL